MSLLRAFSNRRKTPDLETSTSQLFSRAASQRGGRPVDRIQISSPTALMSTTNGQVNYAQTIAGATPIEIRHVSSSSTSSSSSEDSDSSVQSSGTITDASSIDESPIGTEPEPNHLSCYFKPAVDTQSKSISRSPSLNESDRTSFDTPKIPQRAASHSKRAHEGLHRKRSIQRMLSPPPSRETPRQVVRDSTEFFAHESIRRTPSTQRKLPAPPSQVVRESTEFFSSARMGFVEAPKENPFGRELAQLQEVAEEFGQVVRDAEADADTVFMESRGLARFNASDYMFEIQSLIHNMFAEERPAFKDLGGFF